MSLRPRYSLLTLLFLTALIAGGVKLWYGPHRVVERTEPNAEEEYSFTRDWRGNIIKQGILVERIYRPGGTALHAIHIECYRHGELLPWIYVLQEHEVVNYKTPSLELLDKIELSLSERQECEDVIRQAIKQFDAQGSQITNTLYLIEHDAKNGTSRFVPVGLPL